MRVYASAYSAAVADQAMKTVALRGYFSSCVSSRENDHEGTPLLSLSITALSQPRTYMRACEPRAARKIAALAKPTIIEGSAARSLACTCVRACVRAWLRARAYVWSRVSMCIRFPRNFFPEKRAHTHRLCVLCSIRSLI